MRLLLFLLSTFLLYAQEAAMPGMHHDMSQMAGMNHNADPMEASGTSLNPASSPMDMLHLKAGSWTLMAHGVAFIGAIQQSGPRGADKFAAMNWFMGTAEHSLAGGTFAVRSMISLDPATVTRRRYPELFQTGETAYGRPIVDGQHPHDLFMELAVEYGRKIHGTQLKVYAAPVGDPALGPVAFPHRVSAAELPQAMLAHHLQDSTHIATEVLTAGVARGIFGIEASGFHGAEPNENRWNIDCGGIDSWAARLTAAPTANWAAQVSAGRLHHPEALEPGDQTRITASATYNRPWGAGNWATSVLWGRVHRTDDKANRNSYGVESVARFGGVNYVTGRVELVDKDELATPGEWRIGAYTAGYTRDLHFIPRMAFGLGGNFTVYSMPAALHRDYGRPVGMMLFVRLRLRNS